MMRVFQLYVLQCERCGRFRILAAIQPPDITRKILDCVGLPSRPPALAPAVYEASSDDLHAPACTPVRAGAQSSLKIRRFSPLIATVLVFLSDLNPLPHRGKCLP